MELEDYDAILREWLREILRAQGISKSKLATDAGLHKSDLVNATNNKRNVSKEMFVQIANALPGKLATAFHQLSLIADRVQRGELKLPRLIVVEGATVKPEHAAIAKRIVTGVSRDRGQRKKESSESQPESSPAKDSDPSARKS